MQRFELIIKKLKTERGMSMLFALLAFIVATMVAVTITSAALANAGRLTGNQDMQQDTLTLQSAAYLVSSKLTGAECSITTNNEYTKTERRTKKFNNTWNAWTEYSKTAKTVSYDITSDIEILQSELIEGLEYIFYNNDDYHSEIMEITVDDADGMKPVYMSFVIKHGNYDEDEDNYKIIFTFQLEGLDQYMIFSTTPTESNSQGSITNVHDSTTIGNVQYRDTDVNDYSKKTIKWQEVQYE